MRAKTPKSPINRQLTPLLDRAGVAYREAAVAKARGNDSLRGRTQQMARKRESSSDLSVARVNVTLPTLGRTVAIIVAAWMIGVGGAFFLDQSRAAASRISPPHRSKTGMASGLAASDAQANAARPLQLSKQGAAPTTQAAVKQNSQAKAM